MENFYKQYEWRYDELYENNNIIQQTINQQTPAMKKVFGVSCKIETKVIDLRTLERWKERDNPEEDFCHKHGVVRLKFKVTWNN